jgi:hypothetical protein
MMKTVDSWPISGIAFHSTAGELVGGLFFENYPGGTGLMSGSVVRQAGWRNRRSLCRGQDPAIGGLIRQLIRGLRLYMDATRPGTPGSRKRSEDRL